ncbi:MAG: GDSL-type esterase/lipase family protein [Planctomycetota bacterium]
MPASQRHPNLLPNLLLFAGSLISVVLMLAALEGLIRIAHLGELEVGRSSRLKYQHVSLPILEPATRTDGTPVYRTVDPRLPYQSILRSKPPGSIRVIIFGGSATAGLGFSPNVTFARHLDRMLHMAYPDRTVEVVNLGIVAISSKQVKLLVDDACRHYSPDLVIVYSGNNEFLEIHAEKYAQANATPWTRALDLLASTHFYRLVTGLVQGPAPSLAEQVASHDDLRMTQDAIIQDIELGAEEISAVVDRYAENIDEMVRSSSTSGTPILLMSVASNWKWRGRSDLPDDWLAQVLDSEGEPTPGRYADAIEVLDRKLRDETADERHEWLFRRAVAHERLGNTAAARRDYRAAMNADPHLRRAIDAANERVREVAERRNVPYLDTIERIAPDGIPGFEHFYDYVHFSPRGAVLVAAEIFREVDQLGILPRRPGFEPDQYVRDQLEAIEDLAEDFLDVHHWIGFGFDPSRIEDRNLWKYDEMIGELDLLLEREPENVRGLVYRGNARFFRMDGAAGAAQDYRRALEIAGEIPEVRANLDALLRQRTP